MVSALISATVAFVILTLSQWVIHRRERTRLLLGKLEELYLLLLELAERNGRRFDQLSPMIDQAGSLPNPLSFDELLSADLLEQVQLLVRFYFPALGFDLDELYKANGESVQILVAAPSDRPAPAEVTAIAMRFADRNALIRNRIISERQLLTKTLFGEIDGWYARVSYG